MANRQLQNNRGTLEKGLVDIFCTVSIGATGAPTLKSWTPLTRTYATAGSSGARGVKSISRTAGGSYSIVLQDSYQRLLEWNVVSQLSGGLVVNMTAGNDTAITNVNSSTAPTVGLVLNDSTGHAADPANGEQLMIHLVLQNSSAL